MGPWTVRGALGLLLASACVLLVLTSPPAADASRGHAKSPRYCSALKGSSALRRLSTTVVSLGTGNVGRRGHLVLVRSRSSLRHAATRSPRRVRSVLHQASARLASVDRARRMSHRSAVRLRTAFTALNLKVGRRCHMPALLVLRANAKAAGLGLTVATASGFDPGLCHSKSDGRAQIPGNLAVDACWDGSVLHLQNRTSLVQRVSGAGVANPSRTDFPPQEWASWWVARNSSEWVLPPNYGMTLDVADAGASVSISPAETSLLEEYGIAKVLIGYLPFDPLLENAVAGLLHGMDDAVAKARQCVNHANALKRVACSAAFFARTGWVIGSFVVDAGLDSIKKDAVKGTLRHAAGVLWGLVQEGKYIGDVFGDVFAPGSTRLTITAAVQAQPTPQPTASPGPTPTPTRIQRSTWSEQETPNHPVNTFRNYHNASGMGPAIAAGQWVQVYCRVYDPTIQSVKPDGYWYRIASSPWNGAYYSPANTFMNGDPYGGPYMHNTDFNVPNC